MTWVLLVEDEESFSDALSYLPHKEGFEVAVCPTGADALATFDCRGADLVLLGLTLPGLPGTEVCRALRQRSNVPVIMLTAKDTEAGKVMGLRAVHGQVALRHVAVLVAGRRLAVPVCGTDSPGRALAGAGTRPRCSGRMQVPAIVVSPVRSPVWPANVDKPPPVASQQAKHAAGVPGAIAVQRECLGFPRRGDRLPPGAREAGPRYGSYCGSCRRDRAPTAARPSTRSPRPGLP